MQNIRRRCECFELLWGSPPDQSGNGGDLYMETISPNHSFPNAMEEQLASHKAPGR